MKKYFYLSLVAALVAMVVTGCQKEKVQSKVTLGAKIEDAVRGNSKVYINNYTPCWHNGDQVYVNDGIYTIVGASGETAQISDVNGANAYRAIFPANIVGDMRGVSLVQTSGIPVTLPSHQTYVMVGGHQRVDVPMGAYLNGSTGTLEFQNLCSIIRLTISNSLNQDLSLGSIVLRAEHSYLSGQGTASISAADNAVYQISLDRGSRSHDVTLDCPGVTIPALESGTFDIVVPAFIITSENVTITVNMSDGQYYETTKTNKTLEHNTLTTTTVSVASLTAPTTAYLVSGLAFRAKIPVGATSVVFECNSSRTPVSGDEILNLTTHGNSIYGRLIDGVWTVFTPARVMYANEDCSQMFRANLWDDVSPVYNFTSIDFGTGFNTSGTGFNTSQVTNMSNMFSECSRLTSLDITGFNTSNVTDMSSMFSNCSGLTRLDVSRLNTSQVLSMSHMFFECDHLTNLDVSNFNTAQVSNMNGMFYGCRLLQSIDVSNFNTGNVVYMGSMFGDCTGLQSLDLSTFNTSSVTNMESMFNGCWNLRYLNLCGFDMQNVRYTDYMCQSLDNCTISCSTQVWGIISVSTGFPTSGVTHDPCE